MKQLLTLFIGLLFTANVSAANVPIMTNVAETQEVTPTDIDALENALYVEPLTAAPGTQAVLSVRMKNAVPIAGFEFNLQLPDGITVATDGDGLLMAVLSEERTTSAKTNTFGSSIQPDGTLKVLCGTYNGTDDGLFTFSGNDGEVARITVDIPAGYEEGEYAVSIVDAILADINSEQFLLESSITSVLTVGEVVVVLDENSTEVPEATDVDVNILVKRTLKKDQWSTICLPFDMTAEQVYEAFGDDVQLQEFVGYETEEDDETGDVVKITVNFENIDLSDGIEGNYPYVIKTSKDISEFSVTATIDPDEAHATAVFDNGLKPTSSRYHVYGTLYGTYHAQTVVPANCLFLSENKFWYSTGLTKMKAFRAYFEFEDVLSSLGEDAGANISMVFDKPMGIHSQLTINHSDSSGDYYTLDGIKLDKKPTKKGIYIVNGKKQVVK